MNKNEKEILEILENDARCSAEEIAKMLRITPKEATDTITKLKKEGIIVRCTTIINEKKIKHNHPKVRALIELAIRPQMRTGFDKIAARIARFSQVVDHYLISGTYDFLVVVEGKNLEEISSFVTEKLASISHVEKTATHFIMKKYKEHGVLISDEGSDQGRLAITG